MASVLKRKKEPRRACDQLFTLLNRIRELN